MNSEGESAIILLFSLLNQVLNMDIVDFIEVDQVIGRCIIKLVDPHAFILFMFIPLSILLQELSMTYTSTRCEVQCDPPWVRPLILIGVPMCNDILCSNKNITLSLFASCRELFEQPSIACPSLMPMSMTLTVCHYCMIQGCGLNHFALSCFVHNAVAVMWGSN